MPSNHILINNGLEYSVADCKMDELIRWLSENGHTVDTGLKKVSDEVITKDTSIPAVTYKH